MSSFQVQKSTSSDNKEVKQPQNGAQATIVNKSQSDMKLGRSINWSGTPAYPGYPDVILPNNQVMFNHLSDGDFGSTAAVTYSGFNAQGLPCAWVLAWDAPAESSHIPNKVYVTCGKKTDIDNMEFSKIRKLLSESNQQATFEDSVSKTKAAAFINDVFPNKATVVVDFAVLP